MTTLTAFGRRYHLYPDNTSGGQFEPRFQTRIITPAGPDDPASGLNSHDSLTFTYSLTELIAHFDLVD